jgi:DNA-binding LacI/PurR family transcriptional regulator
LYMGHYVAGPGGAGDTTCPQFWAEVSAGRLDGVVILDAPYRFALSERIRNCPVPAVGSMTGYEARIDFQALTTAAVQRLAAQGCRKIGVLGWSWSGAELFRQAIADCGLVPNDAWIRCDLDASVGGAGWEEFREIWSARCGRPDGLVVLDEMLFADAQLAIFELGVRVPDELQLAIQITGGATLPIRLPATLYEVDPSEAAALHVAMLVDHLNGQTPAVAFPTIPFHERRLEEFLPNLAADEASKMLEAATL